MSMKTELLAQLKKGPCSGEELLAACSNRRLAASLLRELVRDERVVRSGDTYSLTPRAHTGAPEPRRAAKGGAKSAPERPAERAEQPERAEVRAVPRAPRGLLRCRMVRVSGGYGFAEPLEAAGPDEDVFIPGRYLRGALPGDEVLVALSATPRREGSREGEVREVKAGPAQVTGVLENEGGRLWLRPDFCREMALRIPHGGADAVHSGEKVAAHLTRRGEDYGDHEFEIDAYFGDAESAYACAQAVLHENGVQEEFPEKVLAAARALVRAAGGLSVTAAENTPVPDEELAGRLDLRGEPIFTIDSASTKDMDDAIDVRRTPDGWHLGVHIADVSHYVRPYSALDKEALARGTSVYFADRVAPMLPRELSNDLCSLNENVDRLAFSCLMELDAGANVVSFKFAKTVIRSRVKGVYEELNRLYDGEEVPDIRAKYAAVSAQLPELRAVYDLLAQKRSVRGSMDIESGESKLLMDAQGRCIGIKKRERGVTECIIEECMILANGCAARLAREQGLPFVYRVHTPPEAERVENLQKILGALGVACHFAGAVPTQPELSALLDATRNTRLESAVHNAVLRTMAKADYRPEPLGHYGLALTDYAHFTSPIRRYPDLAIHRILSAWCESGSAAECQRKFREFAANASVQSSARELVAMTVERSCDDCYKAEYMRQFVGQEFDGLITTVTSFGVYVELENTVEGLVRAEALCAGAPDLQEGVALADPLTGKRWAVGDALRVKLASVSVPMGQIDFVPAEGAQNASAPRTDSPEIRFGLRVGGTPHADRSRAGGPHRAHAEKTGCEPAARRRGPAEKKRGPGEKKHGRPAQKRGRRP